MSAHGAGLARVGAVMAAIAFAACTGAPAGGGADLTGMRLAVAKETEGGSSYGDYLAGSYARDAGEVAAAATFFERAFAGAPDNLEILEELFQLTLAAGEFDQAIERARQLTDERPEADEARLMLAAEAARDGDMAAARGHLDAIGDRGIASLAVPFLDAWAIMAEEGPVRVEDAIARLDQAEPLGPLNDYHEAMLLHLAGRSADGLEALGPSMPEGNRAPARMAEAYAAMLAGAGRAGDALDYLRSQVVDGEEQPHLARALAVLEEGGEPTLPFQEPVGGMADALLGIGEALQQERGGQRAITYVRLAEYLRPDLDDAALLVGDVMAEQENYDASIAAYEKVAETSPLHFTAQLRIAGALYQLERSEDAFSILEEIGERHPERVDAFVQLGDILRRDEEYARAEEAYSRAIERLDAIGPEHWSLFYTRGITRERTKRWPEAEADFLKALELQPEQPFVLNYLGYSWVDMGMKFDEAKDMLHRAVDLRPNDGFIVDSLGWVYYRLGEYERAVEQLEKAIELEPGDPVINDHLGDAYWRVGRYREARYQWERALTLEPEEDVEEQIREKLEDGLPEAEDPDIDRS